MASKDYYLNLISQTAQRSVEATISILGITDKGLRKHLLKELGGDKDQLGLLADPVFESMFPWEQSEELMSSLSGNLLAPSLIEAMDKAGDHRFGSDWYPFIHQLKAWDTLIQQPKKSLIVTSGTGSGKTECFMVPILNDLAIEYEANLEPLVGVRALFIYPLNALINSQRERLRAWTDAYGDGLRFCLFNGNTQENKHKDQGKFPNEVLTRKVMRNMPAPMLVTNTTMLEYMLVRQVDEPIIEKSQGKLRWIVLDEAHTYIGSQAAELSLLLRRVMHAFGVDAKDVRFVATSATIGDKSSKNKLKKYLADISGVSLEQVVVVPGHRSVPSLPMLPVVDNSLIDICEIEGGKHFSNLRFDALSENTNAIELRQALAESVIPSTLSSLTKHIFNDESRQHEMLQWIDVCSNTSKPGSNPKKPEQDSEAFLPVRGHLFHQVTSGLWCCADKNCSEKDSTSLLDSWSFGCVYSQRKNHCECGAPIFELVFCNECNSPHLLGVDNSGKFVQMEREAVDEFSLDYEDVEDTADEVHSHDYSNKVVLSSKHHSELTHPITIDAERNAPSQGDTVISLELINPEHIVCTNCEFSGYKTPFYRRSLFTLLDSCQESKCANELPSRGKRLITFTDSRQGTARISTKIQQDSERDSIRGLMYGTVARNVSSIDEAELAEKQNKLVEYRRKIKSLIKSGMDDIAKDIEKLETTLQQELLGLGKVKAVSWIDAVNILQASQDISRWIFDYYHDLNPQLFPDSGGARVLTEMLLLREFSRRPKRQNSMETLGLVSVQYPVLNEINKTPYTWESLGLTLEDWREFLKVTLDFHVRENSIIDIPDDWVDWMGARIYPKSVLKPDTEEATSSRIKRWPQVVPGRNNRLIRMLCEVCKLDYKDAFDKDRINGVLKDAWLALTATYQVKNERTGESEPHRLFKPKPGSVEFQLSREEIAFRACTSAWVCPFTHRLIDSTFKGISPYLPFNTDGVDIYCRKIPLSICQLDVSQYDSDIERKNAIRDWVSKQPEIYELRSENLWTDVSDRIVEGGRFYRAAEHSAQQPASRLDRYEALFKTGKLNVLSCSTTMEMGVDIGGISVVAMNNVPPHPANYLQRAGRAGRRGETQALAFTICKDNPHERGVFTKPLWPFTTSIAAPYIILNSSRIVQRHLNSLLLSTFLKEIIPINIGNITTLSCEWFFASDDGVSPVERMVRWMESFKHEAIPEKLEQGIFKIIKGSILSSSSIDSIIAQSINALTTARDQWLPGYKKLKLEFSKVENMGESDPYMRKIRYDLKCIGEAYLLSELASNAFLPGYGFPTGIATFDHYSVADYKSGKYVNNKGRIDNQTRLRERPGRDMAVAIREYAPGADIVLDGLVYRSAGILLNDFSPNEDYSKPQKIMNEWRCHECGFIGNAPSTTFENVCSDCGSRLKEENIKEYLEPIGFAVDFYSSPTTDISSQMYIPVSEPWVTADAPVQAIFEPRLGSYRCNPQGHIFNHTSGEFGTGFAVCLRCGKAESMTSDGESPVHVQYGKPHKRLQGKPGAESSAMCEGPDEVYAIKEGVHLGTTDQTDVFELYLKHPNENMYLKHDSNDQLAWTLAVVLRQALADVHGINAEEMGYTVKPSTLPGCKYPVAGIALFDKNGGGAGFSSAAPHYLKEILTTALDHLDCDDNCDSACQSCLMGYDTRFHIDKLNRHVAIEYLQAILPFLNVIPEARIFGDSTQYCLESLSAEILSQSHGADTLRLFTGRFFSGWNISLSGLKDSCLNWKNNFNSIELVLSSSDISHLSEVHKEDLLALENFGINLYITENEMVDYVKGGVLLAQVISSKEVVSFASNAFQSNIPNDSWWLFDGSYLVKSKLFNEIKIVRFDTKLLVTPSEPGDIEIELTKECDGNLVDFGDVLWEELIKGSEGLKASIKGDNTLTKISYSDCYISSPWTLILFSEIVDTLKKLLEEKWNSTVISLITGENKINYNVKGLYADWRDNKIQSEVITEYFSQIGEEINIDIKPIRELPHGRQLTLEWSDGSTSTIRFDHGVGCWSMVRPPHKWFDVEDSSQKQVEYIFDIFKSLSVRYNKKFPTQIFVKKR